MCAARKTVAVIGGGWAGCAAGVELAAGGAQVTLFDAARTLGGRARGVEVREQILDNGQHILLGAYRDTLRLMGKVGINPACALRHLPLQMRYPAGSGGMDFIAPALPAPLHMLVALLRADGLEFADKMALARFSTSARWMDWQLHHDCSVSELLERFDQTATLIKLMWRPLCLAALNTPPERASAQVFLAVLRDSLGAHRAASDMLLPRMDLSAMFPELAAEFIASHGGRVALGSRIAALRQVDNGWLVDGARFDAVIVATPPPATASLLQDLPLAALREQLAAFTYEPITTCYLQYEPGTRLDQPFFALIDEPALGHWGQFVFDRGQLDDAQDGLWSVVISAAEDAAALDQDALVTAVAAQLAAVFGLREAPLWTQVITEKRATFACTPGLQRPANASGLPGLLLAGDYTASDYPATLESAVRSGSAAARTVLATAIAA